MRVLLDTHSLLWFVGGDNRLSSQARSLIKDLDNEVLISVASLWEIVIKTGLGKLDLGSPFESFVEEHVLLNDIKILGIGLRHLDELNRLPLHHRDPFDRLIIAQALAEDLPLVAKDGKFDPYNVRLFW